MLEQILCSLGIPGSVVSVIVIVLSLIEWSKIKINPWSIIFGWIGDKLTGNIKSYIDKRITDVETSVNNYSIDTNERMDFVNTNIEQIYDKIEKNERKADEYQMKKIRGEILQFSNELRRCEIHNEDEFKHIIELHTDYESFIEKYGFLNGLINVEYNYINSVYLDSCRQGRFNKK